MLKYPFNMTLSRFLHAQHPRFPSALYVGTVNADLTDRVFGYLKRFFIDFWKITQIVAVRLELVKNRYDLQK